ncbi:hypothetical protein [Bacillus tuaregi]|uniref:hypothetical protein n=1 Tax=Bacillus tuaregi TaxID=1816695 RepID=UPI0013567162|nr:hypothetical protein [Bacillus tuaregi]
MKLNLKETIGTLFSSYFGLIHEENGLKVKTTLWGYDSAKQYITLCSFYNMYRN